VKLKFAAGNKYRRFSCVIGKKSGMALNSYHDKKEEFKMNASVAIQTLPEAANDEELIRIVDEVIAYIKSTGLTCYVGPFETAIEGDYDELMDIIKECQHIAIRAGAPSVLAYIKVDYRPEGDVLTIDKKVTKHHQ
jgi:uncharacterized protein YqgV (UPF0045/DUF77 family)